MKQEKNIPYKIYLEEDEMPKSWYNARGYEDKTRAAAESGHAAAYDL